MAKKRFSLQKVVSYFSEIVDILFLENKLELYCCKRTEKVEVLALLKKPACPLDPLAQPLP
jgi:hypothetical protein